MSNVEVTYHQIHQIDGFEAPEFFENGPIATVTDGEKTIEIHRDGQALAFYDKTEAFGQITVEPLRTSEEFREAFPDGKIPEVRVEWRLNPWFDLYDGEGKHLDVVGFEWTDMIESAIGRFSVTTA
jgi:hypothetical protein